MQRTTKIRVTQEFRFGAYLFEEGDVLTVDTKVQGMSRAIDFVVADMIAHQMIAQGQAEVLESEKLTPPPAVERAGASMSIPVTTGLDHVDHPEPMTLDNGRWVPTASIEQPVAKEEAGDEHS